MLTTIGADIATVKAAIAQRLKGPTFLAALDDVWAFYADGIARPTPAVAHVATSGLSPETLIGRGFPAGEVEGLASDLFQPESSPQSYAQHLKVTWTLAGHDEELLTAWVERYVLATRIVLVDEVLGADAWPAQGGREDYSPVGETQGMDWPFVKAGVIEFRIPTMANR